MSNEDYKKHVSMEEIAENYKKYYEELKRVYPVEFFEIETKNGEKMFFYAAPTSENNFLLYLMGDKNEYLANKKRNLAGIETEYNPWDAKVWIGINKTEKYFNFGIDDFQYENRGYGTAIYDNYLKILQTLKLADKEKEEPKLKGTLEAEISQILGVEEQAYEPYQIRVEGNSRHPFLGRMKTKKILAKINQKTDEGKAIKMLDELAQYPDKLRFSEFNKIIEYAINSNVSMDKIADAINQNKFNIHLTLVNSSPMFEGEYAKEDFNKFKSFGINGLKLSSVHNHIIENENLEFVKLLGDLDEQDATLEFKKILEHVKSYPEERKKRVSEIGELESIILFWKDIGLLVKHIHPELKGLVKKQAISKFDEFDSKRNHSWGVSGLDESSKTTLKVLSDAEMLDEEAYIALYQKALNRNYDLNEFDNAVRNWFDYRVSKNAMQEIAKHTYYPYPKVWQKSSALGNNHKSAIIGLSLKFMEKNKDVIGTLKQEIISKGIAQNTKIKTDMQGITEDGKVIQVDNLRDWLFGVEGALGNLRLEEDKLKLPPQTPKFAIELVKSAVRNIEYPGQEERVKAFGED